MPAPKLLDKKSINASLATERKQQIDAGLSIAKKVDALRETFSEEEGRLETFRRESVARVQVEIDTKIVERDVLEQGNIRLREERIKAQAPIDLKLEWEKVREDQSEISRRELRLNEFEVNLIAREGDNTTLSEMLMKQKKELREKDKLSERTLSEAEKKFEVVSQTLDKAKKDSQTILSRAQSKETEIYSREQAIDFKEVQILQREKIASAHEIDLSNREQALLVKYETFVRAQNYLKNKKKR